MNDTEMRIKKNCRTKVYTEENKGPAFNKKSNN